MILFFDTETTGFPRQALPVDDPEQVGLVQIAAQLVTPDNVTLQEFSLIVDPCRAIHPKALEVHGITEADAKKYGVDEARAVDLFFHLYGYADLCVTHGNDFDKKVMELVIARSQRSPSHTLLKPFFCTMKEAKKKLKSSNLKACMAHYFGEDFDNGHDAMRDTQACRRVYFAQNYHAAV